jgi:hypothetical protein
MYTLRGEFGAARMPNLEVGNMVVEDEARFQLDPKAKYSFAISNHTRSAICSRTCSTSNL